MLFILAPDRLKSQDLSEREFAWSIYNIFVQYDVYRGIGGHINPDGNIVHIVIYKFSVTRWLNYFKVLGHLQQWKLAQV